MRSAAAFASALLIAPALASANDLMKVYELALSNDPTFLAAQHARDANVALRPIALAPLLPQLVGSYRPGKDRFEFTPPSAEACQANGAPPGCTFKADTRPY